MVKNDRVKLNIIDFGTKIFRQKINIAITYIAEARN